jgi:hypothetical protein
VLSFVVLPKGKEKLVSMNIKEFHYSDMEKTFNNISIFGNEKNAKKVKGQIKVYEENVSPVKDNKKTAVYGYKRSEGLVAFFHNTPNNTLASFWAPSTESFNWSPLFPREEKGNGFETLDTEATNLYSLQKNKKKKQKIMDRLLNAIGLQRINNGENNHGFY